MSNDSQNLYPSQVSPIVALDQILTDLYEAEILVMKSGGYPTNTENKGRVTSDAVRAIIADVLLFLVLRLICKLSTFDVFKKCKTKEDNYKRINKFMNIFFIACIIIAVFVFSNLLYLNLKFQLTSIDYSLMQYNKVFTENHINMIHERMNEQFENSKINLIISTSIFSAGVAISFLSLIPYQRKMITRYNEI